MKDKKKKDKYNIVVVWFRPQNKMVKEYTAESKNLRNARRSLYYWIIEHSHAICIGEKRAKVEEMQYTERCELCRTRGMDNVCT
jgi:hypothetical protein